MEKTSIIASHENREHRSGGTASIWKRGELSASECCGGKTDLSSIPEPNQIRKSDFERRGMAMHWFRIVLLHGILMFGKLKDHKGLCLSLRDVTFKHSAVLGKYTVGKIMLELAGSSLTSV